LYPFKKKRRSDIFEIPQSLKHILQYVLSNYIPMASLVVWLFTSEEMCSSPWYAVKGTGISARK
jgi:hypothetical protein